MRYSVRYAHKITPQATDTGPSIDLDESLFGHVGRIGVASALAAADRRELAKLLRGFAVLAKGEHIRNFRRETDGRIIVFPTFQSCWHSIILTPVPPTGTTESL